MSKPGKIDAENDQFYKESYEKVVRGKWKLDDIIGFELKKPVSFVPRVRCAHIGPSIASACGIFGKGAVHSFFTLLPLYDTILYPISPQYRSQKVSVATFERTNDISMTNFLSAVERGRVIPYFTNNYEDYNVEFVENFLEPGIPRISNRHLELIRRQNLCKFVGGDCKKCDDIKKLARKDLLDFLEEEERENPEPFSGCSRCIDLAYAIGLSKDEILKCAIRRKTRPRYVLCSIKEILPSRNIDGVFQTNCPISKETLNLFVRFPGIDSVVENVVNGLKIKYSPDMDFETYLNVLDERTTRAIREIVTKIMEDPFAVRYSERLNSVIFEYNRQIEDVARTKAARFYESISDIAVYGGSKFVERKTQGFVKARKQDLQGVSKWAASKLLDVHARLTGKDWTITQLYRTRCKLEELKAK